MAREVDAVASEDDLARLAREAARAVAAERPETRSVYSGQREVKHNVSTATPTL